MAIYVWTSDGHVFEMADNTSEDETNTRIRDAMNGQGAEVIQLDLASGNSVWFNGRQVAWAAVYDTDDPVNDKPAVVDFTTMLLGVGGGDSGGGAPGGPTPR